MNDTVTLAMIVRNEARNLKDCLESVKNQVDEIIIVDTGSTDGTPEIAAAYTDKIFFYPWDGDFSAARNFALEKSGGQWILSLDADEELINTGVTLKELVGANQHLEAYMLPLDVPITSNTGEYNRFLVLRLFKNQPGYRFAGRIHEQVMVHDPSAVGVAEGLVIRHKYLPRRERNRKRGRNLVLLKEACAAEPENYFLQFYLGVEWAGLGQPARALPYFQQAYRRLTDNHLLFRGPALRYQIMCLHGLDRTGEAVDLCREALLRYPDYTDLHYLYGLLCEETKDYSQAVEHLHQAVVCGQPPDIYSHMHGTESFLAHYHLGYCYGMLGRADRAVGHYEQALAANPRYIYPVCNLFLFIYGPNSPHGAWKYFQKQGYLTSRPLALAVADLFFRAGHPGLACQALTAYQGPADGGGELAFYLGKYYVFSGHEEAGLHYLDRVDRESGLYRQAQIVKTLAWLLQGNTEAARQQALELWRQRTDRGQARVLLNLARLIKDPVAGTYRDSLAGPESLLPALELLNWCSRYLADQPRVENYHIRLLESLHTLIKNISLAGWQQLQDYYRTQCQDVRDLFKLKFGLVGAAYEENSYC